MNTKQYTIRLKRIEYLKDRILGVMSLKNKEGECYSFYTLEPIEKPKYGCVPKGIYRVVKRYSPKFKQNMYYLAYVHGRSGIMIHCGNTPKDTKGCILVGCKLNYDDVELTFSRDALQLVTSILDRFYNDGYNINLEIY